MTELSSTSLPRKRSMKRCITLGACLALITVQLMVGTVVGVTESKEHHTGDGDGNADAYSVVGICSRTMYPDVCNQTLFGSDTSNPQNYVKTALRAAKMAISESVAAVDELQLSSPIKNGTQYSALVTCKAVLTDCLEQVNTSLSRVSNLNLQALKPELGDIQQYMAAAVTYQDTCLDAVQNFGVWNKSSALDGEQGVWVTMLLSNGLSLVNSLSD